MLCVYPRISRIPPVYRPYTTRIPPVYHPHIYCILHMASLFQKRPWMEKKVWNIHQITLTFPFKINPIKLINSDGTQTGGEMIFILNGSFKLIGWMFQSWMEMSKLFDGCSKPFSISRLSFETMWSHEDLFHELEKTWNQDYSLWTLQLVSWIWQFVKFNQNIAPHVKTSCGGDPSETAKKFKTIQTQKRQMYSWQNKPSSKRCKPLIAFQKTMFEGVQLLTNK